MKLIRRGLSVEPAEPYVKPDPPWTGVHQECSTCGQVVEWEATDNPYQKPTPYGYHFDSGGVLGVACVNCGQRMEYPVRRTVVVDYLTAKYPEDPKPCPSPLPIPERLDNRRWWQR